MRRRLLATMALALLPLGACTLLPASAAKDRAAPCGAGEQPMQRSTLYFGSDIPAGGEVDAQAWSAFLSDEVSPRFPDGLTWFEARGQWRGDNGAIVSEASRVLVLLHAGDSSSRERIDAIAARYRTRFAQESVLEEHARVCARFH